MPGNPQLEDGTVGTLGEPVSEVEFRTINANGAAIIPVAAVLPPVAVRAPRLRSAGSSHSAAAPLGELARQVQTASGSRTTNTKYLEGFSGGSSW